MTTIELLENNGFFLSEEELNDMLELDDMQEAIIGITTDDRLVYDYEKLVQVSMEKYHINEEEAADYVSYNIVRGNSYVTDQRKPVIIESFAVK